MQKTVFPLVIILFILFHFPSVSTCLAKDGNGQAAGAILKIKEVIGVVKNLDSQSFKKKKVRNKLINNLNKAIKALKTKKYKKALDILKKDVLKKVDGCALKGRPDKKDLIIDCAAQGVVYPLVLQSIALVKGLKDGTSDDSSSDDESSDAGGHRGRAMLSP